MTFLRTILIMASFLAILASWESEESGILLKVGFGMLIFIGLTQISSDLRGRKLFESPILAPFLASVFLIFAGIGEMRLDKEMKELTEIRFDKKELLEQIDILKIDHIKEYVPIPRLQPGRLHELVFAEAGIERIRILGINSLGVLHKFRKKLETLLFGRRPILLEVLLLDPRSAAFITRRNQEECYAKQPEDCVTKIPNRMYEEWEAALAILSDIASSYSRKPNGDEETQVRLTIKIYDEKPEYSALFVKTKKEEFLVRNKYSEVLGEPGFEGQSALITEQNFSQDFNDLTDHFEKLWKDATLISLDDLKTGMVLLDEANIVVISEFPLLADEAKDEDEDVVRKIYHKAVTLHRQGRLDEASELYRRVLEIKPSHDPNPQQLKLAKHFLPRVFVTENEPFELKDLVVIVHPSKPLIAYHLVWQDDIDFLTDNDPGDHEIVWIRYNRNDRTTVEQAWAYWHGKFPCSEAVGADARINVFVQWGKHGSLLDGWKEKGIKVTGVSSPGKLETLQYRHLQDEGRTRNDTFYAKKWLTNFEGSREEFVNFSREVKVSNKLRGEDAMVVVTEYANAVIDQKFLSYNIDPKDDWPPKDGDNPFCGTSK